MIPSKRLFGLDFLRAAAIIMVLIDHSKFFFLPLSDYANHLTLFSYFGVELFFVLSGFLIGPKLFRLVDIDPTKRRTGVWNFLRKRWFRTLPNYFLILLVLIFTGIQPIKEISLWKYFLFLQNFNSRITEFYFVSWSLSIEEWFYLTFALLFFLIIVVARGTLKQFIILFVLFMALFPLLRITNYAEINNWNMDIRQVVLMRLDSIGYGILAAYFYRTKSSIINKSGNLLFFLGVLLILFSAVLYINRQFQQNLLFFTTGVGFALIMPYFMNWKSGFPTIMIRGIRWLSLISYSLYLVNYDIVLWAISDFFDPYSENVSVAQALLWFTVFWLISLSLSSLVYKYFEFPIMKFRDRLIKDES